MSNTRRYSIIIEKNLNEPSVRFFLPTNAVYIFSIAMNSRSKSAILHLSSDDTESSSKV